jgi:hypothetical protein
MYVDSADHFTKLIDSSSGVHPLVTTTDTQTLTGKTLDGVSPTTMGFLDATSSIQTQINAKQATLTASQKARAIGATFDGGGSALASGKTLYVTVPFACTISAWNVLVDTGTATIKTWKIATGTAIPTVSNSISTSGVAISSGTAVHSTTVTDFTSTAVSANDIVAFNLFAVSSATNVNFVLECDQ